MILNPRFIVGGKVESRGQQIIRAIFIFLTHSQQSTVNSQQSTVNNQQSTVNSQQSTVNSQQSTMTDGATRIDITPLKKGRMGAIALRLKQEGMPAIALRLKQASERVFNQ
jgi:hypothetical protein